MDAYHVKQRLKPHPTFHLEKLGETNLETATLSSMLLPHHKDTLTSDNDGADCSTVPWSAA